MDVFQQCSWPIVILVEGLTLVSQVASNTDTEECRHAVLEEVVTEMQCGMKIGLEEKSMILEGTQNERQIRRNWEGFRETKIEVEACCLEKPPVNSQGKIQWRSDDWNKGVVERAQALTLDWSTVLGVYVPGWFTQQHWASVS